MSLFESWKIFQRWCAAIPGDYEVILHEFLNCPEWDYVTFKKLVQKVGTVYMHQCALRKGKKMDEHFERVSTILIEAAKDFWLFHPMKEVRENLFDTDYLQNSASVPEPRLKSMIGGFYLTFTMFKTTPEQIRKTKILMDATDLFCLRFFMLSVAESKLPDFYKIVIRAMLLDLSLDGAFRLCVESRMVGIDPAIRSYRNIADGDLGSICMEAKRVNDDFVVPVEIEKICEEVTELESSIAALKKEAMLSKFGLNLFEDLVREEESSDDNDNIRGDAGGDEQPMPSTSSAMATTRMSDKALAVLPQSSKSGFKLQWHISQDIGLVRAMGTAATIDDVPMLSLSSMLGNLVVDRTMMKEARIRRERLLAKRLGRGGQPPVKTRNSKPYMDEGGIFGRKQRVDEDEAVPARASDNNKEGATSGGHLWSYINTCNFIAASTSTTLGLPSSSTSTSTAVTTAETPAMSSRVTTTSSLPAICEATTVSIMASTSAKSSSSSTKAVKTTKENETLTLSPSTTKKARAARSPSVTEACSEFTKKDIKTGKGRKKQSLPPTYTIKTRSSTRKK